MISWLPTEILLLGRKSWWAERWCLESKSEAREPGAFQSMESGPPHHHHPRLSVADGTHTGRPSSPNSASVVQHSPRSTGSSKQHRSGFGTQSYTCSSINLTLPLNMPSADPAVSLTPRHSCDGVSAAVVSPGVTHGQLRLTMPNTGLLTLVHPITAPQKQRPAHRIHPAAGSPAVIHNFPSLLFFP